MNDRKVGHCLILYLENLPTLSALDAVDELPEEVKAEGELIASFRERAAEQAVSLLEAAYSQFSGSSTPIPYRTERRSQRRTVRDTWTMEGRLFRPRERTARSYWSLCANNLRGAGPALVYIVGPSAPSHGTNLEGLALKVAQHLAIESAVPRAALVKEQNHGPGVLIGVAKLTAAMGHDEASAELSKSVAAFIGKFRQELEQGLD